MSAPTPHPSTGFDPLLHFGYAHLTHSEARKISRQFHDLAQQLVATTTPGPERSVALRKLLEAKDAAVRAVLFPGS